MGWGEPRGGGRGGGKGRKWLLHVALGPPPEPPSAGPLAERVQGPEGPQGRSACAQKPTIPPSLLLLPVKGGGGEGRRWGGWGEQGGGPCWEGLQLPLVLANRPLADPGFPGGYPFEAKKRGPKKGFGCGGRIWRGVPVLTTYTPPARGLGG